MPLYLIYTGEIISTPHQDDALALLSKAIGGYNQGIGTFNGTASWSEELIDNPLSSLTNPKAKARQKQKAKAIKYVLDTLKNTAAGKTVQNVLPYRHYIWKGGTYPADLVDDQGQPDPKAGTDWCFAWGEQEWLDKKEFSKTEEAARGDLLAVPPIQPQGRIDCTTGNPI